MIKEKASQVFLTKGGNTIIMFTFKSMKLIRLKRFYLFLNGLTQNLQYYFLLPK